MHQSDFYKQSGDSTIEDWRAVGVGIGGIGIFVIILITIGVIFQ